MWWHHYETCLHIIVSIGGFLGGGGWCGGGWW
jgi:hypothetical protein